jgi:CheY-like chemotaxis protein
MATQSLVISRDPDTLTALRPVLNEMEIGMEICLGHRSALALLSNRKFDAVVVDCADDDGAFKILQHLRETEANRNTLAIGIVSGPDSVPLAFEHGATFALSKPLPVEEARRIFNIARGIVSRVVRRFLRVPVDGLCYARLDDHQDSIMLNLCQGGVAVQTVEPVEFGSTVLTTFHLPGTKTNIECESDVVWVDNSGRCGLQFRQLAPESQSALNLWIVEHAQPHYDDRRIVQTVQDLRTEEPTLVEPPGTIKKAWIAMAIDMWVVLMSALAVVALSPQLGAKLDATMAVGLAIVMAGAFFAGYRMLFTTMRRPTLGDLITGRVG